MEIPIEEYAKNQFIVTTVKVYANRVGKSRVTIYRWLEEDKLDYIVIPSELEDGSIKKIKHIKSIK
jgi:predicted site-specific integrase-resolvase